MSDHIIYQPLPSKFVLKYNYPQYLVFHEVGQYNSLAEAKGAANIAKDFTTWSVLNAEWHGNCEGMPFWYTIQEKGTE
jgi:hypothetical protein